MNLEDWLQIQQQHYQQLPEGFPPGAFHPVSGEWQNDPNLADNIKNQFWWGGGATKFACKQLEGEEFSDNLSRVAVLTFGPVQEFLGGGQRLRDWAVASWLCHYLTAVLIIEWEKAGGKILLPWHHDSDLVKWLKEPNEVPFKKYDRFWQAELPNVILGLYPAEEGWLQKQSSVIQDEWKEFLKCLEKAVIELEKGNKKQLLNGQGWKVVHNDAKYLWSVYTAPRSESSQGCVLNRDTVVEDIKNLHQQIEADKNARNWEGTWWSGLTSPSSGALSVWHPGLRLVHAEGGTWGLPKEELDSWWQRAASDEESLFAGVFSSSDRLNSIELIKRLASVPKVIELTLQKRWYEKPPENKVWEHFPDRTSTAAAWVAEKVDPSIWNQKINSLHNKYFINTNPSSEWGMPKVDSIARKTPNFSFTVPEVLERRNVKEKLQIRDKGNEQSIKQNLKEWENEVQGWESAIEWTVGWRGDGDNMGKWLSGKQYQTLALSWAKWHPNSEMAEVLGVSYPEIPENTPRKIELPHILDLSVLFTSWNQLLYDLAQKHHNAKVIFAGGDDFLLLGPITETVPLTTNLYQLWRGQELCLDAVEKKVVEPLNDGWIKYEQSKVCPIPGSKMDFSLGVVIAQRRVPQSLWHRGLNQAYKQAKNQGKNRVCVKVLFNSGQSLDWVCPWPLWNLLMSVSGTSTEQTELNRWEKMLSYLESTHLRDNEIEDVQDLLDTLWKSLGINLNWQMVTEYEQDSEWETELSDWQWWINWICIRGFLARQEREREKWLEKIQGGQ